MPDSEPDAFGFVVRDALDTDAQRLSEIYAPYVEHTPISFEEVPPTASEMLARMREYSRAHPFLVITSGSDVVGYAYASPHGARASYRWSTNVAVYIDHGWHRRGLGRTLYTSLLGRLSRQGYVMAFAGITLPNANSVGLHESLGFKPVGVYSAAGFKLGAWRDVGWWQRPLTQVLPATPVENPGLYQASG